MSDFTDPDEFADPDATPIADAAKTAAVTGGVGVASGLTGYGAGRVFNMAFPGITAGTSLKNATANLDKAIRLSDSNASLKGLFNDYMTDVVNSGKGMTFADWVASNGKYANLSETIKDALAHSGQAAPVLERIENREMGAKDRVLSSLATELGVPQDSLTQTLEKLQEAKRTNAAPLYSAAFQNKSPIKDAGLLELFQKHAPAFEGALTNAQEAFKYDPDKQVQLQTAVARGPQRKDWWKSVVSPDELPDYLQIGEPFGGEGGKSMAKYISPNVESLDRMKRALWVLEQKRLKEGAGDVGAVRQARRDLTDYLDKYGPPEYLKARKTYSGDIAMEEAADMGSNLFKADPTEVRKSLLKMSPEERSAFSSGFYGSVDKLYNTSGSKAIQKLLQANENRDVLGSVFTDPVRRDSFINSLNAEAAMRDSLKEYTARVASKNPYADFHRGAAALGAATGHPVSALYHGLGGRYAEPSRGVSSAITDIAFHEPTVSPAGVAEFPKWYRGAPKRGALEMLKRIPKSPAAIVPAIAGGLGALYYENQ